jgi:hypothetical protein
MGFLDKLFGPPTPEKFAQLFMAQLKRFGDPRQMEFDAEQFRLLHNQGNGGIINLGNFYREYCRVPRSERSNYLQRAIRAMRVNQPELPDEFEHAAHDLLPKIWCRAMIENLRLQAELHGQAEKFNMPHHEVGSHLVASVVYDLPESMRSLSQDELDGWGVTYYQALEAALRNLEQLNFNYAQIDDRMYVAVNGDAYDSSRILLLDRIRSMEVQGDHVAMLPNRETLIVTGSEDELGLEMMLDLGEKALEEPRPLINTALRLEGDEWVDWMPPPEHKLYPRFRLLELKYLYSEYAEQKVALEKLYEARGIDRFVASFSAVEKEGGEIYSYCLWSQGVVAALPQTQRVVFFAEGQQVVADATWERVQSVVGDLMQPLDVYPPRYLVTDFPSPDELREIGRH